MRGQLLQFLAILAFISLMSAHVARSEKLLTLTSAIGVEIEFWDKDRWKKDEYLGGYAELLTVEFSFFFKLSCALHTNSLGSALITLDRSNGVVQDGVLTAACTPYTMLLFLCKN